MSVLRGDSVPTIAEFFCGKNILVTGGSGFIGKVLLEKLLRSCPDVGNIYVLLREKKGKSFSERLNRILDQQLFVPLKEKNPEIVKKIVPIGGDISKIGLGLSDEDRNTIIDKVNVVFHIAASVRFDDPLKTAILQNVRSTREVIYLLEQLKNLAVFVHVSTAYSNCDNDVIEEKLYPPTVGWKEMIRAVEETEEPVLQYLTQKFIGKLPNTYTFSKALAEHVVNDLCRGRFPTVILRPSIVLSSVAEPLPGWIDNFNGPFSLFIGAGMGFIRIVYGAKLHVMDHISVDNFVKSLMTAAWLKAVEIQPPTSLYFSSEKQSSKFPDIFQCLRF